MKTPEGQAEILRLVSEAVRKVKMDRAKFETDVHDSFHEETDCHREVTNPIGKTGHWSSYKKC